jgi:PPOX class probable F420-dependent enzyme
MTIDFSPDQVRFIHEQRVGRLTTVDGRGEPFAVPVCFAFDGACFYTPIDEKPKRTDRPLKRVRNVWETGRATLLLDRYDDDDWSRLAWLMIRGSAGIVTPIDARHAAIVQQLRDRYAQYQEMRLEAADIIELRPERVASWGLLTTDS